MKESKEQQEGKENGSDKIDAIYSQVRSYKNFIEDY